MLYLIFKLRAMKGKGGARPAQIIGKLSHFNFASNLILLGKNNSPSFLSRLFLGQYKKRRNSSSYLTILTSNFNPSGPLIDTNVSKVTWLLTLACHAGSFLF